MAEKKHVNQLKKSFSYRKFNQIDGSHPLKDVIPGGYVDYQARKRSGGKIAYFNFALAKEMGLISKQHPDELNSDLEQMLLDTFSIQIINEYDQLKNKQFPKKDIKSGHYMATRYLQLQHDDKNGKTSGDGRSIWNGQFKNKAKTWDVSSCGTGGTRLSPATSKYNKFFETGDPAVSYGCGYAEIDEGYTTAIFSQILQQNAYSTEQNLVVVEYQNNLAINVRVHENLLRPSHIFLHLKQDDLSALTNIVDYYIERQSELEAWGDCPSSYKKYDYLMKHFMLDFSTLAARFEDEYIFCWLDWDGDNILMDGGIIDYGSIRQFGLFHCEYRYDDVDRYSTNILEQKKKARYIVQRFLQAIEYIKTKEKSNIQDFANHKVLMAFDENFETQKNLNILNRMGLSPRKAKQVLKRNEQLIIDFRKTFSYFEQAKSVTGKVEIADGITWDAIFSMRNLLRELPLVFGFSEDHISAEDFIDMMKSDFALEQDLEVTGYRKQKIQLFQEQYLELMHITSKLFQESLSKTFEQASLRSLVINKSERITGDAVTHIVALLMKHRKKLKPESLFQLIQSIRVSQNLNPDLKLKYPQIYPKALFKEVMELIKENREGI